MQASYQSPHQSQTEAGRTPSRPGVSSLPARKPYAAPVTADLGDDQDERTAEQLAPRAAAPSAFTNIPVLPSGVQRAGLSDLAIGRADDPLEDDAGRLAEHAIGSPAPDSSGAAALPARAEPQRAESSSGVTPPIVHEALRSSGQPLDPQSREFFEPRFGRDSSRVRVHADEVAAESVRSVGALAFNVGSNIAFGAGLYQPATRAGRRLLAHELAHVAQSSVSAGLAPVLRRALPAAPSQMQADTDWPNWAGHQTFTPDQNRLIDIILANRAAVPIRPDLRSTGTEGGPYVSGHSYGSKAGKLAADASRYLQIAMKEYWPTEGGVAAINTWDTPVKQSHGNFTLGPGMLNSAAAGLMRTWIDADPAVAQFLRSELGVWVTASLEVRVVVGPGDIRVGNEALGFMNDSHILSGIMNLAEKGHGEPLDKAEQDWVSRNELPKIPPEVASWNDAAIACCLHLQHGAPAYSWARFRTEYVTTNGDPLEIAKVFAVVTARLGIFSRLGDKITGPILVTSQWGDLVYRIFGQWGVGGGQPGYLQKAIDTAGIRVSGTRAELGANPDLAGHVLYKIADAGKALIALDIGPPASPAPAPAPAATSSSPAPATEAGLGAR